MLFTHKLSNDSGSYLIVTHKIDDALIQIMKDEKSGKIYGYVNKNILSQAKDKFPDVKTWFINE